MVSTSRGSAVALGGFLLVGSAVFVAALAFSVLRAPGLIADNNISEFGIHAPTAFAFNAGLIAAGVATLAAAGWWRGAGARICAILSLIAGCGMVGAGIVTIDVARLPHAILAAFDYGGHLLLTATLSALSTGAAKWSGLAATGISVFFLLLWAIGTPFLFDAIGQGGAQLLAIFPLAAWMIWFSGRLLFRRGSQAAPLLSPAESPSSTDVAATS
ncbi:MAG: hypothetical protein AB7O56_13915 [Bauldia sp.]